MPGWGDIPRVVKHSFLGKAASHALMPCWRDGLLWSSWYAIAAMRRDGRRWLVGATEPFQNLHRNRTLQT